MIAKGEFLEWESVHDNLYGTPGKEISGPLSEGLDVILDIDVKGALTVKEKLPEAVLIFVDTPSMDELVRRLSPGGRRRSSGACSVSERRSQRRTSLLM